MLCKEEVRSPFHRIFQNLKFYLFFQKTVNFVYGGLDNKIRNLLSENITPGSLALDIGCGTGEYSGISGGKCLSIDLNMKYLSYAISNSGKNHVKYLCMSSSRMGLQDGCIATVYAVRLFHHLSDDDIRGTLREVMRLLKPDGKIVFFDIVDPGPGKPFLRRLTLMDRGKYVRSFDENSKLLEDVLGEAKEKRIVYFSGNPFPYGLWTFSN